MSATLRLAWPIVGAQLLSLSMVFVDSVMVARLGPRPLAAMAMAIAFNGIFFVVCIGMLSPLSAMISQDIGRGAPGMVARTVQRGLCLALGLSAAVAVSFVFSDRILLALGQDHALVPLARQFLVTLAAGVPAILGYMTLRGLTEGVSDTRPAALIALGAALTNALLDYGLIYGNFGLPRLELIGSALSTAICQWGMFLSLLTYIGLSPRYRRFRQRDGDGHPLGEILRLGLPFSGSLLAESGFFAAATFLMGRIGVQEQASHHIALNAVTFVFMIPLGLSFALAVRIGGAWGASDLEGVRTVARAGVILIAVAQCATAALFLLAPQWICRLYTDDPALTPLVVSLVRIGGLFQLFDGIQVGTMGLLRGLLDSRIPFWITLFSYWAVGMPCALILAWPFQLGPLGLWYGMVCGLGCASVLLQLRFWSQVRRGR